MKNNYSKILVPHDGSQVATAAIPHAVNFAKAFQAEILVLQVVDAMNSIIPAITSAADTARSQQVLDILAKKERLAAKKNLEKIKKDIEKTNDIKITTEILTGDPRDVIIETVKKHNCNLIVMSTRGRSGLKRAFLGSVADDIVRHSSCPVLLIHPQKSK